MKITKKNILSAAKEYCRRYGEDYAEIMRENGGENAFVRKVIELDQMATLVVNVSSLGKFYKCIALGRSNVESDYGMVKWAYGKGYATYNSAEVICRGGYPVRTRKSSNIPRYDIDGDFIEEVNYSFL